MKKARYLVDTKRRGRWSSYISAKRYGGGARNMAVMEGGPNIPIHHMKQFEDKAGTDILGLEPALEPPSWLPPVTL